VLGIVTGSFKRPHHVFAHRPDHVLQLIGQPRTSITMVLPLIQYTASILRNSQILAPTSQPTSGPRASSSTDVRGIDLDPVLATIPL